MTDSTNARKSEVIDVILGDPEADRRGRAFDSIRLRHRALPELDLDEVDTSAVFLGRRLSFPLLISPMTGGDHDRLRQINRNLAMAAEAEKVAMGVGSQRVMFTHPESRDSFALRPLAPSVPLLANLGAVQLNYGFGVEECRTSIRVLEADGLYLHVNPLQESVQPEGNTEFGGLTDRIAGVAAELDRPVLVKEVGAGFSPEDVERLYGGGIRYVDVAGSGGTSWSRVEHGRQSSSIGHGLGRVFQDWGTPTPDVLRAIAPLHSDLFLIASGGIRSGVDMAKAMVLGASLCGVALPFLEPALESAEAVARVMARFRREFQTAMFLMGIDSVSDMIGRTDLEWSEPARAPGGGV